MWKLQSNKALPFTVFYYILSVVLYLIALPLLILLSLKPKYKQSIPARFFLYKNKKFDSENGVWFHVCSLGEAKALKPVLEELQDEDLKITTITHTGFKEANKYDAEVRYLPYEMWLPFWMKKQRVVVVLEAEFWYMLFVLASSIGSRVILLNARISERSAKKYLQFSWFYEKLLSRVDIIYAQSEADKNRFLALGARDIEVVGNIKLAGEIKKTKDYNKPEEEVIVAGSTHESEEKSVLEAFVRYVKNNKSKLIMVPRHPERFESVYLLMEVYAQKHGLSLSRFSEDNSFSSDMVLVDAMGELNNIYNISDIAILGGAFREDIGGHNPLEPAFFGCKIITGKHFFHQKELFKYVHHVQYVETNEIADALMAAKELPPSMVDEKIDLDRVIDRIKSKEI
ncbi:lipid IV(A) 3-deoxy-D-manno-octulosonic acid transferase [Sulfurimonas sp.]|uniref:lipid IV(A) 3-deoxy-D-manno-octulosonic acid transferase n=1 Tax=Sulfurimonas sp. TaxID=2022749 RepID=UPI003569446B